MGFLSGLFGKKKRGDKAPKQPPARPTRPTIRRFSSGSISDEPELQSAEDYARRYPLPAGYAYVQTPASELDLVVGRQADGEVFPFLLEETLLTFDVPEQKPDGSWGKRTVEVFGRG